MWANAFGSDWAQLRTGRFRLRDPLNKERRFIPLRLYYGPIKGSLAQSLYKTPPRPKELRLIIGANLPFGLAGTTIQSASRPGSSFLDDPKSAVLGGRKLSFKFAIRDKRKSAAQFIVVVNYAA